MKWQSASSIDGPKLPVPVAGCQTQEMWRQGWAVGPASFRVPNGREGKKKKKRERPAGSITLVLICQLCNRQVHGYTSDPSRLVWRPLPPWAHNSKKWQKDGTGWGAHGLLRLKCRIAFKSQVSPISAQWLWHFITAPPYNHACVQQPPRSSGGGLTPGFLTQPAKLSFSSGHSG